MGSSGLLGGLLGGSEGLLLVSSVRVHLVGGDFSGMQLGLVVVELIRVAAKLGKTRAAQLFLGRLVRNLAECFGLVSANVWFLVLGDEVGGVGVVRIGGRILELCVGGWMLLMISQVESVFCGQRRQRLANE